MGQFSPRWVVWLFFWGGRGKAYASVAPFPQPGPPFPHMQGARRIGRWDGGTLGHPCPSPWGSTNQPPRRLTTGGAPRFHGRHPHRRRGRLPPRPPPTRGAAPGRAPAADRRPRRGGSRATPPPASPRLASPQGDTPTHGPAPHVTAGGKPPAGPEG